MCLSDQRASLPMLVVLDTHYQPALPSTNRPLPVLIRPPIPTPAEDPVRWVRLDPAGELLCDIKLLQPERMLVAQLLHSRDVVAQAEAVQRLGELRVSSLGLRQAAGMEALRRTLDDRAVFYR